MKSKHRFSTKPTEGYSNGSSHILREPSHNEISELAKAIWEGHGRPLGQDTAIWHEAERRLRAGSDLAAAEDDVAADTRVLLGEPADSIEGRLQPFGEQDGIRSATSL
jgi:hypothetical protein